MPFAREKLTDQDREYLSRFTLKSHHRTVGPEELLTEIVDRSIPAYWIDAQFGIGSDPDEQHNQFSVLVFEGNEFPIHMHERVSADGKRWRFEAQSNFLEGLVGDTRTRACDAIKAAISIRLEKIYGRPQPVEFNF